MQFMLQTAATISRSSNSVAPNDNAKERHNGDKMGETHAPERIRTTNLLIRSEMCSTFELAFPRSSNPLQYDGAGSTVAVWLPNSVF
jgi:hypothetical protein